MRNTVLLKGSTIRLIVAFVLLTIVAFVGIQASAQPAGAFRTDSDDAQPVINDAYYRAIEYQWVDDNNEVRTSNLAEPATHYNQIVAMLREVYTNPRVPGFIKDPLYDEETASTETDNGGKTIGDMAYVKYAPCVDPIYGMDPEMKDFEPEIEGATALLVKLSSDFHNEEGETCEDMLRKIKQVRILTSQMYIGNDEESQSENPGYLFNYVGMLDQFFIITKGCTRIPSNAPDGFAPFYNMFEEFSPANTGPTYNAYADMSAGNMFQVDHNCSGVMMQDHVVVMSPESVEKEYAMNFMFYLPDYRFAGDSRRKKDDDKINEWYTFYNEDHQPFFFFNRIDAVIPEKPVYDTTNHTAKIKLEWESTYKKVSRSRVPEQFYIYRVINDVIQPEPLSNDEYEIAPSHVSDMFEEEDGSVVSAANRCSVYITEPQDNISHDVRYIVKGRRYGSDFELVESNVVLAHIKGYANLETLSINITGKPKSDYDEVSQRNLYENVIELTDNMADEDDETARLLAGHIDVGTVFTLGRFENSTADSKAVATMTIDDISVRYGGTWAVWYYDATIKYADGREGTTAAFKSLKSTAGADGDRTDDFAYPIQALDGMNGILASFTDKFYASTESGDHPSSYHYYIVYESKSSLETPARSSRAESRADRAVSNVVDVAVPVRDLKVGYVPYSLDQILADTDASQLLAENNPGIQFETRGNPSLSNYTVRNVTKGHDVVNVTRMPTGQLSISRVDRNGVTQEYSKVLNGVWAFPTVELDYPTDRDDQFVLILTYANGNTYGNRFHPFHAAPKVNIVSQDLYYLGKNVMDEHTYWTRLEWGFSDMDSSGDPDHPFEPYDFRLWGKHNGYDVNDYDLIMDFDPYRAEYAPRRGRGVQPQEDTPSMSHEQEFTSFAASEANPVEYNHIVRLYSVIPEHLRIADDTTSDSAPIYMVTHVDRTASLDNNDHVISGIENVESSEAADGECIYFDVMGRRLDGANLPSGIVIRACNGRTEKILIK